MKASERCSAQSQGDRCRKAKGHEHAGDLVHEGQNATWQASKFREEKFPVLPFAIHFENGIRRLRAGA